ncbi:hypothetical protein [Microbaculum marinum]|uniref:Uncharacterized protein n=1 Tax=Microbaculum marinum TaxID=1764581 RepID=A0AAW9RM75_9HYPH
MNRHQGGKPEPVEGIVEYKSLLRDVIDRRPSGTRRRLAEAIGKNPSFVSQITNPAYPTPIPAGDVEAILELCHFSPEERTRFLEAYANAHPRRVGGRRSRPAVRSLTLKVPDLGAVGRNVEFDRAVQDFVTRLGRLMDDT